MADKKITTYDNGTAQEAKSAKLLGVVSGTTKLFDSSDVTDLSAYVQKSNTAGLLKNDGTVDTNTYLTQHQDISGKQDKLVSGTNIKTINNQSLLGSGNITIEGGGSSVQSDWDQTDDTADDYIKNKPTIPDAQIQSDWNQTTTSAKDFIKNKPTIPTKTSDLTNNSSFVSSSDLASVATSGSYNDLINKPDVYTKQEADDVFLKGESSPVVLPEGYEQVSNIKTTGEQYINTGYTPNPSTFGFFIDIKTENPVTNNDAAHIFVAGKRTDNAKYRVALTMYNQTTGGEIRLGASTDKNPRLGKNLHTTLEIKNKVITYPNGSTVSIATEIEDVSCSTSLYLFALNNNGVMQRFTTCRLYRFQIYEDSTLVRDFVPARRVSDGKLGLYELLGTYSGETGYFFVNEGSGADFTVEDTISGLGDFVNNSTLVNDAVYVHTDNNFTNAFKNQVNTNTTDISNLKNSIPAVVDVTLEYDLINEYNTNNYSIDNVDFEYDDGETPSIACDIQANVTINLYVDTDGTLTKAGEFTMTSRGKFMITSIDVGQGQSIQAEHITLPLMFGQNYIVDCDIIGISSQYTIVTPLTLVEDAIQYKVNYSDVQLTQATFNGYMRSGEYYVLSEPVSSLSIQVQSYNTLQESTITFTVSGSSFDVTLPSGTKIIGDKPTFINGNTYIMSYFNGMVVFGEVNTYVNPA